MAETHDHTPQRSPEPMLLWLNRRTEGARRTEAEFADAALEYRRIFSEAWGTYLLVLVAAGGGVVGAQPFGHDLTLATKVLAPGVMVMGIIYFMGTISGAHLNPAVTLAFAVRGNFPWSRVPGYLAAQLAGAVLASLTLQWLYGGVAAGATRPAPHVSTPVALATEALLTLGLVSVILGTATGARNIGTNGALAIGGYIGLVAAWAAPVTGASMNPARSFGPDLVAADFPSFWVYVVGPLLGALVAVAFEFILRGRATRAGGEAAQGVLDENAAGL